MKSCGKNLNNINVLISGKTGSFGRKNVHTVFAEFDLLEVIAEKEKVNH